MYRDEKIFACNQDKGVLYFFSSRNGQNILTGVDGSGREVLELTLPGMYGNQYDAVTVFWEKNTRIMVGISPECFLFYVQADEKGEVTAPKRIGDTKALRLSSFWVGGNYYLSVQEKKNYSAVFLYEKERSAFTRVWEAAGIYPINVREAAEGMLGVEVLDLISGRQRCLILDAGSGKTKKEISLNDKSEEAFCCDTGSYLIASNVLGERRFFSVPYGEGVSVELLDAGYQNGHVYTFLYCADNRILVFQDAGAVNSDIVFFDMRLQQEKCRIRDAMPYENCVWEADGRLFLGVMDTGSQLRLYAVDLSGSRISTVCRYGSFEEETEVQKRQTAIGEGRFLDYLVYTKAEQGETGYSLCMLHGGPYTHWYPRYDRKICTAVKKGFQVYYPNYFGSSGYGKIDYRREENKWGVQDAADVIGLGRENMRGKRILYGESYGGFLAFLTWLKSPDMWDAVILYAPFFTPDSLQKAKKEDVRTWKTLERCKSRKVEAFIQNFYPAGGAACDTEFFVIHGRDDETVPCEEAVRLTAYLQERFSWNREKPKLYLLDGVGHAGGGAAQERKRDRMFEEILEGLT